MNTEYKWKMVTIRSAYWTGFIFDLFSAMLSLVYMLAPNETFINRIFGWPLISDMPFLVFITECALMFGWTTLLLWGNQKPIERKGVLLLTIFPVLTMILSFNIIAIVQGNIYWSTTRIIIPAIALVIVIIGYILAYQISKQNKTSKEEIASN